MRPANIHRVLVVRTVHYPTGNATVGELTWLLSRLKPEVIFLEHAPSLNPHFMGRTLPTLESAAVLSHIERSAPQLVPVDAEIDPRTVKPDSDELLNRLAALSVRYQQLELLNTQQTARGGFAYLNSPLSTLMRLEIEREMLSTVQAAGDPVLSALHHKWRAINETRESAMIQGVEEYARQHSFLKAVLLVGAAHGPSLYSRTRQRSEEALPAVCWEFDWPASEDLTG